LQLVKINQRLYLFLNIKSTQISMQSRTLSRRTVARWRPTPWRRRWMLSDVWCNL